MKTRIDFTKTSPQVLRALFAMNAPIEASGLEPALLELVKMRASQINGCAYCLDMHTKDARAAGETERRCWNRFNIAFRPEVGGYRPGMFKHMLKTA